MTKDNIITLPNPHLREQSKRVAQVSDDIRELVAGMQSAAVDWEDSRQHEISVALAAVQIDTLLKIVVVRNNFEDKADRTFRVFINPKITKLEGTIDEDYEGCLSITDVYGKVPRYSKVRLKAMDLDGREFRLSAKGFLARVLQHEIDHTNGILFIDHIKNKSEAFFKLTEKGLLEPQDYEKDIRNNRLLW